MTDYLNSDTTIWFENTLEYLFYGLIPNSHPAMDTRTTYQMGQNFLLPVYRQAIILSSS